MTNGYHNRYLNVDLSSRQLESRDLSDRILRGYLGGSGLGTYLALRHSAPTSDPLGPEAPIVVSFAPFIGTPLTTSARFSLVTKSPLTHRVNDSLCGSQFALAGKRLGFDAWVISGRCEQPSVVVLENRDQVPTLRLVPANDLWGSEITDAEDTLRTQFGSSCSSLVIGPAGENLVRFATVAHRGRHAGRGGTGAVFGSKLIKAIVVRGDGQAQSTPSPQLVAIAREWSQRSLGPATEKYRQLGTVSNLPFLNRIQALPSKNFQAAQIDDHTSLDFTSESARAGAIRSGCVACTIGCGHAFKLGPTNSNESSKPVRLEYESLFALGPMCDVHDRDVVLKLAERCDQLGMDTISFGGTAAFVMECQQKGILDEPFPDAPKFGDGDSLLRLADQTARREGVGRLVAEGSRQASLVIGQESEHLAAHVKGLEIPGYDPRAMQSLALSFVVGSRGADHNKASAYEIDLSPEADRRNLDESVVPKLVEKEEIGAILDSLILCKFLRGIFSSIFEESAEALSEISRWEMNGAELQSIGRRIINAKHRFNCLAGWSRDEDMLPSRMLEKPAANQEDPFLRRESLTRCIDAYYQARDWDSEGRLSKNQLEDLLLDHE